MKLCIISMKLESTSRYLLEKKFKKHFSNLIHYKLKILDHNI